MNHADLYRRAKDNEASAARLVLDALALIRENKHVLALARQERHEARRVRQAVAADAVRNVEESL